MVKAIWSEPHPARARWHSGWLQGVHHCPSPHHDDRPAESKVNLLVIHGISLPAGSFDGDAVLQLFAGTLDLRQHASFASLQGLRVSAHFFVRRDGRIWQCVSTQARAWHAGASAFLGRERCNDFSIGIEVEGCDDLPYTLLQYRATAWLCRVLTRQHPIAQVVGHMHIAPGRKTDPGPTFEWHTLRALSRLPRRYFAIAQPHHHT